MTVEQIIDQIETMAGLLEEQGGGDRGLDLFLPHSFTDEERERVAAALPSNIRLVTEASPHRSAYLTQRGENES